MPFYSNRAFRFKDDSTGVLMKNSSFYSRQADTAQSFQRPLQAMESVWSLLFGPFRPIARSSFLRDEATDSQLRTACCPRP